VRRIGLCGLSVVVLAAVVGSASGGTLTFSGNLCTTVSKAALAALKVTAPCVSSKPNARVQATPLGSIRTVEYRAVWRKSGSQPQPYFAAQAIYVHGSAAAVAYAKKHWRAEVINSGTPVSLQPLAYESAETANCHNPPTGDCTKAEILGLVGQYAVTLHYGGPAPYVAPDDPQDDDSTDAAQEDAIKKPFVAAAKSIMAALS